MAPQANHATASGVQPHGQEGMAVTEKAFFLQLLHSNMVANIQIGLQCETNLGLSTDMHKRVILLTCFENVA